MKPRSYYRIEYRADDHKKWCTVVSFPWSTEDNDSISKTLKAYRKYGGIFRAVLVTETAEVLEL